MSSPSNEVPASGLPVLVVSRDGAGIPGRRAFEDGLLAALSSHGVRPLLTPHVYHLEPPHPLVNSMDTAFGDLVVGAWMAPRAAFWTLRALGVRRPALRCLDLGAFASPDECARALCSAGGGQFASALLPDGPAGPVRRRWYPVLDESQCRNCKQCLDFCLFGVYALAGARLVVASPDNCKDGCPACARTCPHGAIIFPDCADRAIAGAPSQPLARPAAAPAGGPDDLEDLISALEELDE